MANISSTQMPDMIHSMFDPAFYTIQTNQTAASDFYFSYKINIESFTFNGRTVALEDKYSYINPTEILKAKSSFSFNPLIQSIVKKPEAIIKYDIYVAQHPAGENIQYAKRYGSRSQVQLASNRKLADSNSLLLSDIKHHEVYCDTDLTYSTLNGIFSDTNTSIFTDSEYSFYDLNGVKLVTFIIANSYTTSPYTNSATEKALEIPVGIPNLNGIDIIVTGNLDNTSTWFNIPVSDREVTPLTFLEGCDEIRFYQSNPDPTQCDCECIDKTTGQPSSCGTNSGCSDSPLAEVSCYWGTFEDNGTTLPCRETDYHFCWDKTTHVFNYDCEWNGSECRNIASGDPCTNPDLEEGDMAQATSFGVDTLGVVCEDCSWNISTSRCEDQYGEDCIGSTIWVECNTDPDARASTPYHTSFDNYSFKLLDGSTTVSETYTIQKICQDNFDGINLAWENEFGGTDYWLFTKADEKSVVSSKNVLEFSKYYLNTDEVVATDFNKTTTVIDNESYTIYEVNSNWLTQEEIDHMEFIFRSTNVYAKINNEWVYVINTSKKSTIYNKKRTGLKKYRLYLEVSEKTYR